jgi:hypothetical protein
MKEKLLQIRVDDDDLFMLNYLKRVNRCASISEYIRKLILKEFDKEMEWTPCKEQLPPPHHDVLVSSKIDVVAMGYMLPNGEWWVYGDDSPIPAEYIVAWRELLHAYIPA